MQVLIGTYTQTTLIQHVDQLIVGNDQLLGGDGNDLLVGDQQLQMAPTVTVVAGGMRLQRADLPSYFDIWSHGNVHLYRRWYVDYWNRHRNPRWNQEPGDTVLLGSDALNGGAGDDVLYGDSLALDAPRAVIDASVNKKDVGWARGQTEEILTGLTGLGGHHDDHGWFYHLHTAARHSYRITDGGDVLSGGDGRDLLFGQGDRDSLDGGAGADWLIGGHGQGTQFIGVNKKEDKLRSGDDHSSELRNELQTRLINWGGQYTGFGSSPGLGFPGAGLTEFSLEIDDTSHSQFFVVTPQPKRR